MQLVIISGKGGTGKTTVAASLAWLIKNSIKADLDVEASNLHIILPGKTLKRQPFSGAKAASIDAEKCIRCGRCQEVCRFEAISDFVIDELKCEGCAACTVVCPENAISMHDEITGDTVIDEIGKGSILSRAEMMIGAEGSGKLVTEVRKNALKYWANDRLVIMDGSPGVGCPVMASITGCDAALIVVEPTQSGLDDFLRVLSLVKFFNVKPFVCINKYDINEEVTKMIEKACRDEKVSVIGEIPFDETVKKAINELKPVVAYPKSTAGQQIIMMWNRLKTRLDD